jgi:hypothetical protein
MGLLSWLLGTRPASSTPATVPSASMGMYQGVPLPQDPRTALTRQILPAMSGPPGVRLSMSTNRGGRYFGTDGLPPLRFPLTGPPKVNQPTDLETAAFKSN